MSGTESYIRILNGVLDHRQRELILGLIGAGILVVLILVLPWDKMRKLTKRQKQKEVQRKKYHPYEAPPKKHPVLQFLDRHSKALILAVLILICVAAVINECSEMKKLQTDIDEQNFVTHTGEFYYYRSKYRNKEFYWSSIGLVNGDGSEITVYYPDKYGISDIHTAYQQWLPDEDGTFRGTIVYAENSRTIVYWEYEKVQ